MGAPLPLYSRITSKWNYLLKQFRLKCEGLYPALLKLNICAISVIRG